MSNGQTYNWTEVQETEAQALKKGEFQGMVMQALKDLGARMDRIERQNDTRTAIEMLVAGIVGGISGLISGGKFRL